ncbi:MAG TPA: P-type conjugative transfer protein TrbG [Caulobacteraceae bacterium]|jgi:type IV secretion system protein VirB9
MDSRRLLTLAGCALALTGCASITDALPGAARAERAAPKPLAFEPRVTAMAPIPNPPEPAVAPARTPTAEAAPRLTLVASRPATPTRKRTAAARASTATGRAAIAEANAHARAPSRADAFEGGVQMFEHQPGRIYEVWSAPYRVTTLTLAPGETVVSKAAGDTVRWQIGETTSGSGAAQRTHVLLKPLERGLETNLVLTTSQRVYMLLLRSGAEDAFNAAVAWRYDDPPYAPAPLADASFQLPPTALDAGRIDARYRIEPRGGRPRWTPTSVFNDGRRTFIAFAPDMQVDEAPVLFVLAPDGDAQVVNYRQQGGMFIVDRLFDRAELRLGAKRPQVVRISRLAERRASR